MIIPKICKYCIYSIYEQENKDVFQCTFFKQRLLIKDKNWNCKNWIHDSNKTKGIIF